MIAAVGDLPYNLVRFVHLVSIIVGMGVALAAPLLGRHVDDAAASGTPSPRLSLDRGVGALVFPSLLLAGIAGGALVGMSSDFWDFQQTWLAIGGAVWMLSMGAALAAYPPAWLRLISLDGSRQKMVSGILHLSLAVMLVLMVWKPGAPEGAW